MDSADINDNSDSDDGVKAVFQVPEFIEGENPSGPPMTGEQYLRRVIAEAKTLPGTFSADVQRSKDTIAYYLSNLSQEQGDQKQCMKELKPDKEWQLECLRDFTNMREQMEARREKFIRSPDIGEIQRSLPHHDIEEDWLKFVTDFDPETKKSTNLTTKLCLAMTQSHIWSLLEYFSKWMSKGKVKIENGCRWVFFLMACLEIPLSPDVCSSLRDIARVIIDHRAKMTTPDPDILPHINVAVCIVGRYFNQTDLADPF